MMSRRQMLMMLTEEPGGLPAEYLQVEYLTSTSGAYFNLPQVSFDANDSIRTQIKFRYLGPKTNNFWVAGDGNKTGGAQYEYGYSGGWWWRSGNFVNDTISDNITAETTKNSVIEVDWAHIYQSSTNDFVFRLFQRTGFSAETDDRSIYYLKFYKNNKLLHNLVPCIRISDSKPGMYDLVGQQFYVNAGTGEFLVGMTGWDHVYLFNNNVGGEMLDVTTGQTMSIEWDCTNANANANGWVLNGDGLTSKDLNKLMVIGNTGSDTISVTGTGQVRVGAYSTSGTYSVKYGIIKIKFS